MSEEKFHDVKLYELILDAKKQTEERRDEVNKYYTSLFTGLVGIIPILNNFIDLHDVAKHPSYFGKIMSIFLPIIGLSLSVSWILSLQRMYTYLIGVDELLIKIEKAHKKSFISFMSDYLSKHHAPGYVTKQVMLIPYTFAVIFLSIATYFVKTHLF